jgi:hypothetical protein
MTTRIFGLYDFRDVGDVVERSGVVNSLASQEFGSDYTDPYLVRGAGVSLETGSILGLRPRFTASYELQSPLSVHATPVTGTFLPTIAAFSQHAERLVLELNRPPSLWIAGTELTVRAEASLRAPEGRRSGFTSESFTTTRGVLSANVERPFGNQRFIMTTTGAAVVTGRRDFRAIPPQELVYFGGPVSAPGYDFHSLVSRAGFSEHVEWRVPTPFVPFSLGRFGRVPARGSVAPYVHVVGVTDFTHSCVPLNPLGVESARCGSTEGGFYPSVGGAFLLPFDLVRVDVARGVGRGGRWTFAIDVSREFWSIL